tara:strand:- start:316 stop:624 length:309 start_codon:yes stop_codon:yes gene_type:complete
MNQEIPLSGGDAIINAVSGQWGIANIALSTAMASIMPSLTSSALFAQSAPVFSVDVSSTMPPLRSSVEFYNGILNIVIGKGNNINTVVKSRNINTNTKTRYS